MRRVDGDGNVVFICLYVDDVTYAVSYPALADQFLAQLRERFVIEEEEGKPIEYLLGIAIYQDLHLNMPGEFFNICIERNHWELLIIEIVINRETYPWSFSKQNILLMMGLTRQKYLLIQIMQQTRLEGQLWDE